MKKALITLAVAAAVTPLAHAQSSVVIYGLIDAGLVREKGGATGNLTAVTSGVSGASRIGFRGTEDLGGGNTALFVLETGYRVDTGTVDVAGSIFNRQAYVGIKNNEMGQLTLGRQYTPYYLTLTQVADPWAGGYAGTAKNLFPTAGNNTRASNTMVWAAPKMGAFSGDGFYSLGEQTGSSTAGRQFGLSVGYSANDVNVRVAYNNRNNDLTAAGGAAQVPPVAAVSHDMARNLLIGANWKVATAKVYAAMSFDKGFNSAPLPNSSNPYGGVKPTPSTKSRVTLIGAALPIDANTLIASYSRKNDLTAFNQDADQLAVGLTHTMSVRTSLYATYAHIKNRHGAGYTVGNNTDVGSGNSAFNVGIRHAF